MSNPPEYRRRLSDEESAPLFKDGGRTSLELETASTTYPPILGQSSTSINEERPTVNYTFRPRKPDQGQKHSAIGVVGRTKAVSYFLQFIQLTSRTEPVTSCLVLIIGNGRDSSKGVRSSGAIPAGKDRISHFDDSKRRSYGRRPLGLSDG